MLTSIANDGEFSVSSGVSDVMSVYLYKLVVHSFILYSPNLTLFRYYYTLIRLEYRLYLTALPYCINALLHFKYMYNIHIYKYIILTCLVHLRIFESICEYLIIM